MSPLDDELGAAAPFSPLRRSAGLGRIAGRVRSRSGLTCFAAGLALSAALLWPLTVAPTFRHDDPVEMIRLFEMDKCVRDGQLPCRWAPDLAGGRGEPLFNFYPPLPYYVGELAYLPTHDLILSAKVMFALPFLGAFAFMFLCARRLWGDVGGLVAGVSYSYAPYHALDLYIRGAMNEVWAFVFLPAVVWSFLRLRSEPNAANTLVSSASVAALVLTHNLSAMIFLPMAVPLALGPPRWRRRELVALGGSLVLGALLSAFYAIPAYFEQSLVHVDQITRGIFDYRNNFQPLGKVLAAYSNYAVGWYQLLGCALALPVLVHALRRRDGRIAYLLGGSFVLAVVSIFMTNERSAPVWTALHPLRFLQFPWRFLETATFFLCLAAGAVSRLSLPTLGRIVVISGLMLLVVGRNASSFQPTNYIHVSERQVLAGGSYWVGSTMHSIVDYLPKAATRTPLEPAAWRYRVSGGEAVVAEFRTGSDWTSLRATSAAGGALELSTIWFPGWVATVNGRRVPVQHDNPFGLISVQIPKGVSLVRLELHNTGTRLLGDLLSVLGMAVGLLLAALWVGRRHARRGRRGWWVTRPGGARPSTSARSAGGSRAVVTGRDGRRV